jgi:hypothetical protein
VKEVKMAVKFKITKAAFDKLDEVWQGHYEPTEDGKHYTLDINGLPEPEDAGELKRALERVRDELKEAQDELKETQTSLKEAEKAAGENGGDVKRLTKRYEQKLKDAEDAGNTKIAGLKAQIEKLLKGGKAAALAAEVSTAPDLLKDHIEKRMTVEFPEDGEPVLKFLTKDGKPAAADFTLDKLKQEVVADPAYKSIIVASKAKGGGAPPASSTGFVPPSGTGGNDQQVPLTKMDNKSFTDTIRERVQAKQNAA